VSLVEMAMKRREREQMETATADAGSDGRRGRLSVNVPCSGCGRLTRAEGGRCSACQRAGGRRPEILPVVALLPTEYLLACVAELKRRQAEIAKALGGES
jgi:hypothetical protein